MWIVLILNAWSWNQMWTFLNFMINLDPSIIHIYPIGYWRENCINSEFYIRWRSMLDPRYTRQNFFQFSIQSKVLMQEKLFQRCTHFLYCSVLSLGEFHNLTWNPLNILVIGNYYVNFQNYQNLMLLTSSDTKHNTDASILVNKFRLERTGFNMHAENKQQELTFLTLLPWL